MLNQLQLTNFQCHEKLTIDFDESITSIVGPSDVGKSAIIRAWGWVCTNYPQGDAFIRSGSDGCEVTLKADGKTIKRVRGKENLYFLDDQRFAAFSNNVPDQIADHLKIGSVNLQSQHDAPFWFSLTSGQVSREINEIVDLGSIDDALGYVASEVRTAHTGLTVAKERYSEAKAEKESLGWVDDAVVEFEKLKGWHEYYTTRATKTGRLAASIESGEIHRKKANEARKGANRGSKVVTLGMGARNKGRRVAELEKLIETASRKEVVVPDMIDLDLAYRKLLIVLNDVERLQLQLNKMKWHINEAKRAKKLADKSHEELERKTEGKCPLCGRVK